MFRRRHNASLEIEAEPSLPSNVKFALKEKKAQLTGQDIVGLFGNHLGHMGFYMAMKASTDNDEVQVSLLNEVAERDFEISGLTAKDAKDALGHLATKDPPVVNGQKLGPVSSLGLRHWNGRFRQVLGEALNESPESPLFMVANAPYVGFDEIAALSLKRGRPLGILKPERFGQDRLPVGFNLTPGVSGIDIEFLDHNFPRPDNAIIFDDAQAFGKARSKVLNFWGSQEGHNPHFITAFVDRSVDGRVDSRPL